MYRHDGIRSLKFGRWEVEGDCCDLLTTTPVHGFYFCRYVCCACEDKTYVNYMRLNTRCRKCVWIDKPVYLVDGDGVETDDTLYTSTVKDIATVDEQLIVLHNNGLLTRDGHYMDDCVIAMTSNRDEWFLSYIVE
jgi:hypothetical protein